MWSHKCGFHRVFSYRIFDRSFPDVIRMVLGFACKICSLHITSALQASDFWASILFLHDKKLFSMK